MRRCRGTKGRFKRCGSGGGRKRRRSGKASGRHCRFGVNKRTKRCLKRKRARR